MNEDFNGRIVKCIDSVEASLNEIEEKRIKNEQIISEEKIVSIGTSLIKVTHKNTYYQHIPLSNPAGIH